MHFLENDLQKLKISSPIGHDKHEMYTYQPATLARDAGERSGKTFIEREEYKGKGENESIWKDLVKEGIEKERLGLQNRWTIYIFSIFYFS